MALRPTSCKEALHRWEQANEAVAAEAKVIELQFQWPPIEKMDATLSTLVKCEKLSLSTNMIDKIVGIAGMRNLKILALGRNNIKSLGGIETVSGTLEQLWISYNQIDKLKGIGAMKKLQVLYISNNIIKEWEEFQRLEELPELRDLNFTGNPITDTVPEGSNWRAEAISRLQQITKLDGIPIVRL